VTPAELAVVAASFGAVFFSGVATLGVVRLPDAYSRAHATSKVDTLGSLFAFVAAAFAVESTAALAKLALVFVFVLVTNPTASHAVARSAYLRGQEAWTREGEP
jgi:multicomponent Na+:H+ antiporter subunit G